MEFLSIFAKHFVDQNPCLSDVALGIMILAIFIGGPYVIYQLFRERLSKGRFVFQVKKVRLVAQGEPTEQLYLLDSVTGELFFVSGKAYYNRIHRRDWKEEQRIRNRALSSRNDLPLKSARQSETSTNQNFYRHCHLVRYGQEGSVKRLRAPAIQFCLINPPDKCRKSIPF